MVGWISFIIYESGIVAHFNYEAEDVVIPMHNLPLNHSSSRISLSLSQNTLGSYVVNRTLLRRSSYVKRHEEGKGVEENNSNILKLKETSLGYQNMKMQKELYEPNPHAWRRLSPYHWQGIVFKSI
jgi:hypothetical protein